MDISLFWRSIDSDSFSGRLPHCIWPCLDLHQSKEGQQHYPSFSDLNPGTVQLSAFLQKHKDKPTHQTRAFWLKDYVLCIAMLLHNWKRPFQREKGPSTWCIKDHFPWEVGFQSIPWKARGTFFTRSPLVNTGSHGWILVSYWELTSSLSPPSLNSSHFVYKPGRACVLCSRRVEWEGGGAGGREGGD